MTFRLVCSDGRSFRAGTVLDLSTGGVRFRTSSPFEVGARVELLPLGEAGEVLFSIEGRVVRCEPAPDRADRWHAALAFVEVTKEAREALERLTGTMPTVQDGRLDPDPAPAANDGPAPETSWAHLRLHARITAGFERRTGT